MSDETRQADSENRRLVDESTCIRCRYWLCGLSVEGLCPECGERIEASLGPNRLLRGDPGRLRQMQLGCVGIASTPLLAVLCAVIGSPYYDEMFFSVLWTLIGLWFFGAMWLFSVRPHAGSYRLPSESIRRRLRVCWAAVAGVLAMALGSIASGSLLTFAILGALGSLLSWLLGWQVIEYAWQLAYFADTEALSRRFRATKPYYKLCAIGVVAFATLLILSFLEEARTGKPSFAQVALIVPIWLAVASGGLLACIHMFVLCTLLIYLAIALNRPLREARVRVTLHSSFRADREAFE